MTTSTYTWYDSVYGSEVNNFAQATLLARVSQRRYVEPNGQYDSQYKFRLNERFKSSAYYIFVVVDRENYLDDFDTSNNQLAAPKMIQIKPIPLPNLEPTSVLVNDVAKAGERFLVEWLVTNIGEGEVKETQKWTDMIEIFLVENGKFRSLLKTSVSIEGKRLAPNGNYQARTEVVLPLKLFGEASVQVIVNQRDTLYESTLDDNKLTSFFTILPPDTPDLSLLSLELSKNEILTGQELLVSYTVENEGNSDLTPTAWNDDVRIMSAASGNQIVVSKTYLNSSKSFFSLLEILFFINYI